MNQKEYTRCIELKEELLEVGALIAICDNKILKQTLIGEGRSIAAELFELTGDPKYKL
jgi:hypothetical protein